MIPEHDQRDAVQAVIVAFARDAERLAELTAIFLTHLGLDGVESGLPASFLLELGAVLRIRQWEVAGIKDVIDGTLPSSDDAFADLAGRLQSEPEQFSCGEAPLLQRVLLAWWFACAHPAKQFLNIDVAVAQFDRGHLLSCVARLLWNLRDAEIDLPEDVDSNE